MANSAHLLYTISAERMKALMKKKIYAVKQGRKIGLFPSWEECEQQIKGYAGAKFKSFPTEREALSWLHGEEIPAAKKNSTDASTVKDFMYIIYTDGSCLRNPDGPGGWAAILTETATGETVELHGGETCTTNNRMELTSAIAALAHVEEPSSVALFTDSQYLKNAFSRHWIDNWKRNGWKTSTGSDVKNKDLWMRLDTLFQKHRVTFHWVKGHAGNEKNERCDHLAKNEAMQHSR